MKGYIIDVCILKLLLMLVFAGHNEPDAVITGSGLFFILTVHVVIIQKMFFYTAPCGALAVFGHKAGKLLIAAQLSGMGAVLEHSAFMPFKVLSCKEELQQLVDLFALFYGDTSAGL